MTTIAYEDVKDAVFDEVLVWSDSSAELDFYRWAWEKISPALDTDDPVEARLLAVALAYVYAELCFYVCDQNFYEDLWYRLVEFVGDCCWAGLRIQHFPSILRRSLFHTSTLLSAVPCSCAV